MKFLIAIEPGTDDTAWGVIVPDLPGCFSAGDSLEQAFDNAREAIDGFVQHLVESGGDLPKTVPLEVHQRDPDYAGMVWAMVEVPIEKYFGPAEKINITVPAVLLVRIDRYAAVKGESRSGLLTRAAIELMAHEST